MPSNISDNSKIMNIGLQKIIRYLSVTLVCAVITMGVAAQNLGTYVVTRTQIPYYGNGTYVPILNGTNPTWNCGVASVDTDNAISQPILIGFNFPYNGLTCKSFYVSTNGFIVLDTISTNTNLSANPFPRYTTISNPGCNVASTNNYAYNDSCTAFYQNSTNNFSAMSIAPFYNDLITFYDYNPNYWIHYHVSGTSPNRVLTVEWYLMQLKGYTWSFWWWDFNFSYLCFQTKLYESSGNIEFWYSFNYAYPFTNLASNHKYVIGLNSNAYTSTLPNTNYILTDSIAGMNTFTGRNNFLVDNPYPSFYYHKITFSRPGADIGVSTIYPPNPDTCTYSTSQIIVDTLVNFGSLNLTFNSTYPLKVYTQITGAINVLDSGIFTGSFPAGGSIGVQMTNPVNMSAGGTYNLKAYTNSTITTTTTSYTDQNFSNDTATSTYYVGSVSASAARSTICSGDTTQLSAASTTFGHLAKISYSAPTMTSPVIPSPWTSTTIPDDGVSNNIPIGFNFYYFGKLRTVLFVSSNGNVQFSTQFNNSTPYSFPTNVLPTEIIALAWKDLKPNYSGVIQYKTMGITPNREFILEYAGVADTSSSTTLTAYLILHESTNIIEFQNGNIPYNFYNQGIEDSTGTISYGLGSRNANNWSASNEAYLLESQANYSWSPTTSLSNPYISNPIASPTVTTTYTVTLNGGNPGYPDSTGVCPKTNTVTVNVTPGMSTIGSISGPSFICSYTNVTFTIPAVTNATSYIWDYSSFDSPNDSVTLNYIHSDTINLTLNDNSGIIKVRAYDNACGTYTPWATLYITVVNNNYGYGQWVGGISTDWFNALNWCGGLPTSTIDANIDNSSYTSPYFPVINASGAVCQNMNIAGVGESLTIYSGYNLDVYGTWQNGWNGFSSNFIANSNSSVTFKGATPSENITGYIPTTFNNIIINRGSDTTTVLENLGGNQPPETINMTGNLTLTNGLFRVSEPTSSIQYNASTTMTIPATAGLELNGGNFLSGNFSITNYGLFRMTAYATDDTLGNTSGNSITNTGSSALMDIEGGKLIVASQIIVKNGASFIFNDINTNAYNNNNSGQQDTIILNKLGTTNNIQALLNVDASSNIYITDGYFIFHNPNSGTGYDLRFTAGSGTKFIDPSYYSTFQFGDANTSSSSATFKMVDTAGLFLNNLAINPGGGHDTLYFYSPVSLNPTGSHTLNSGILKLNSNGLVIYNQGDSAISRTTGFIISEDTNNYGSITRYIPEYSSQYIFPFGNKYGVYIPVIFTNINGGSPDTVQVSTYAPSDSIRHKPLPLTVTQTRDSIPTHINDSSFMVNRFWQINANNVSTSNYANVVFSYAYNERPLNVNHDAPNGLRAQRWVPSNSGWLYPSAVYAPNGSQIGVPSTSTTAGTVTVNRLNHCSNWTLTSVGNPLPIELLSFTAANESNKYVLASWVTASEINNDHFEIERSKDGINFELVGKVAGAGNSNQILNYSLNDETPYMGLSYYRLKQVDFNGNYTYSEMAEVQFNSKQSVSIYPNPNDGNFVMAYNLSNSQLSLPNSQLVITDITGRVVYSYTLTTMQGFETIDASLLSTGIYYWEVITGNGILDKGKIAIMK